MLSVEEFMEKIEKNPKSYFLYTLENIINKHIIFLKNDLEDKILWGVNPHLFTEIEDALQKMKTKKTWLIRFLSFFIPVNKNNQSHKKRLNILIEKLNLNLYHLETSIQKNTEEISSLSNLLKFLKALKRKLSNNKKNKTFLKNKFFIKEIDDKITLLEAYNLTLNLKEINLLKLKKVYQTHKYKGIT